MREVAILITAREMDSQFEWCAHENEALKVGVAPAVVDAIKHRKSTAGLDETDAVIIDARPADVRRPQGDAGNLRQGQAMFGPHQLVDLVLLMGNYAGTAALLCAFDMQLHNGQEPLLPIP